MENKLKLLFMEMIYNKLELSKIEEKFIQARVPQKEVIVPDNEKLVSHYFFLNNDVRLDELSSQEITFLERKLSNLEMDAELYQFLETNMLKMLLPKTEQKSLYWGPMSFEYVAPSDCIVLGCHYLQFDGNYTDEMENLIVDELNNIQFVIGPSKNLNVAVIQYNEINLRNQNVR